MLKCKNKKLKCKNKKLKHKNKKLKCKNKKLKCKNEKLECKNKKLKQKWKVETQKWKVETQKVNVKHKLTWASWASIDIQSCACSNSLFTKPRSCSFEKAGLGVLHNCILSLPARFPHEYTHLKRGENRRHIIRQQSAYCLWVYNGSVHQLKGNEEIYWNIKETLPFGFRFFTNSPRAKRYI